MMISCRVIRYLTNADGEEETRVGGRNKDNLQRCNHFFFLGFVSAFEIRK